MISNIRTPAKRNAAKKEKYATKHCDSGSNHWGYCCLDEQTCSCTCSGCVHTSKKIIENVVMPAPRPIVKICSKCPFGSNVAADKCTVHNVPVTVSLPVCEAYYHQVEVVMETSTIVEEFSVQSDNGST